MDKLEQYKGSFKQHSYTVFISQNIPKISQDKNYKRGCGKTAEFTSQGQRGEISIDKRGDQKPMIFCLILNMITWEKYPLTKEEIRRILQVCNKNNTIKILAQLSSDMRKGELLQLKKRDLGQKRIMVNIPASITKTKRSRVTFFSREIIPLLMPILRRLWLMMTECFFVES